MEANTVILTLSDYESLKEFKKNVETNGKRVVVYKNLEEYIGNNMYRTYFNDVITYLTTDEALIEIGQKNEELVKIINDLRNKEHQAEVPKVKEISISDVKKMSVFEFLKWKKT